jgi:hypothetical protein
VAVFTLFFANTFRGFYLRQLALIQERSAQLELLHRRHLKQGLKQHLNQDLNHHSDQRLNQDSEGSYATTQSR